MIKSSLLLCVIVLSTFSLLGQELFDGEIRWGEQIKLKKKEYGPDPIGALDDSFYATKTTKSFGSNSADVLIQMYGLKSLAIENETELDLTYLDFDLTIMSSFVFSESVIFITKYIDKKEKKQHYLLHKLENGTNWENLLSLL